MSPRQWVVFILSFLIMVPVCIVLNTCFAGVIAIVVFLFDSSAVSTVFKWIIFSLTILEIPALVMYMYDIFKNERNEV